MAGKIGRIHSVESFGTVDGPGIRMVIFLSGCPMRCIYCHNPDTWDPKGGKPMTVEEILAQFEQARPFYKKGGITVSGGEPLMQIPCVTELFEAARARKIHTCLDTSGVTFNPGSQAVMAHFDRLLASTDLILLDIKHIDPKEHVKLCAQPHLAGTEEFITVFRGNVGIEANGRRWELSEGDSIRFKADVPHGYWNMGDSQAQLSMIIFYGRQK